MRANQLGLLITCKCSHSGSDHKLRSCTKCPCHGFDGAEEQLVNDSIPRPKRDE